MAKSKEIIEHEIRQLEQACQNSKEVSFTAIIFQFRFHVALSTYLFYWIFYLLKYT